MSIKGLKELTNTVNETLPESIKETDGIMSTLLGFVNNVIFYPLKKANVRYRYKLEQFTLDLKNKTNKIPEDNFQEPSLSIIGPTLEALRYTIDEENLREMFINLLTSSMDNREDKRIHPSYVEIIKQLSVDEARLLKRLSYGGGAYPIIDVHLEFPDGGYESIFTNFTPIGEGVCEWPGNIFSYLNNLSRLGIIEIPNGIHLKDNNCYLPLENHAVILMEKDKKRPPGYRFSIHRKEFDITDFGRNFISVCVREK